MPWCPICKTEYRSGFTHCADCGAELVENLPESIVSASLYQPAQPAFLMHCPTTFEADATVALLHSFDIPCFSQPDMSAEKAYTGVSMTGERIFVEQERLTEATEIVSGFRRGRGKIDEGDRQRLMEQAQEDAQPDEVSHVLLHKMPKILMFLLLCANFLYFMFTWFQQM